MSFAPEQDNSTTFECTECGYLTVKQSGYPTECINCGRNNFRKTDTKAENKRDNDIGMVSRVLNNASSKQMLYYLVLGLAFMISMVGIVILILI